MALEINRYHALEKWDKPRDGLFQIITNSWWIVNDEGAPLVFTKANSPQCNESEGIAKRIAAGRPIRKISIVYLPVKPSDFA